MSLRSIFLSLALILTFGLFLVIGNPWSWPRNYVISSREDPQGRQLAILMVTQHGCRDKFLPVAGYCLVGCAALEWKTRCVVAGLREIQRLKAATHVIMADQDVFFADWTPRKIFDVFDSFKMPVVLAPERTLWRGPFGGKMKYDFGENIYVNSGTYMGEIDALVDAFEHQRIAQVHFLTGKLPIGEPTWFSRDLWYLAENRDDQTLLNLYANENYNKTVAIDSKRKLFYTLIDLLDHQCKLNVESNLYEFDPPMAQWDPHWCGGYYMQRKEADPPAPLNLRDALRGGDRFCRLRPPGQKYCQSEWGLDEECQAFVNQPSHDRFLKKSHPLILHANGGEWKPLLPRLIDEWGPRCPPTANPVQFDLLALESTHTASGLHVPLTKHDVKHDHPDGHRSAPA